MGLDMYLNAKRYVSQYDSGESLELFTKIKGLNVAWPGQTSGFDAYLLQRTCAYWRKANQIHAWFVNNVQGGVDDCREYNVSIEQLTELRDLCVQLLADRTPEKALELLPPQDGFLFGGTEIDEWYWSDLQDTVDMLTAILEHPQVEEFSFTYRAS